MNSPLVILAIVVCGASFGFSWAVTIGNWLDVAALDVERNWGIEGLTRLAFAGAALSVITAAGLIVEKLQKKSVKGLTF